MKRLFLLLLLLGCFATAAAQNCYEYTRTQGINQYNKGEYRIAKDQFTAAKDCPDKPADNDLDSWISKCNSAIAEANRQAEEERKRREAQQAAQLAQQQSASNAAKGYMNITKIEFANTDYEGKIVNDYGSQLQAANILYLKPRVHYNGLSSEAKKLTLYIKLLNPDGTLRTGTDSPEGYTYSDEATVSPGSSHTFTLSGWGSKSGGSYKPGIHRFEVWYNNKCICQTSVTLHGAREATYLRVNNQTAVTSSFGADAGSTTYNVSTDAAEYEIRMLPSWCTVTDQTSTSFTIKRTANPGEQREDWFEVRSGEQKVRIDVTQAEANNNLSRGVWRAALRRVVNNHTDKYDNGCYKGEKSDGVRSGLGIYAWDDESYYLGRWSNGDENGIAIYIVPDGYHITNCPDCVYFVGKFSDDEKSGKGTCYDAYGNLIYYGDFKNNKPTETYPTTGNYSAYRFECIKYDGGDIYLGETKNGQREGQGLYIWESTGNAWYGPWKEGNRDGYGIYFQYSGSVSTGTWDDSKK